MNSNQVVPEIDARLVTLSDGRRGLRSGLQVEVSEPPALNSEPDIDVAGASNSQVSSSNGSLPRRSEATGEPPILDFMASDETLDRCDEVIQASGWRLDSYRRNPVFQNAHQYGDVIFTLGKALITEVRSSSECRVSTLRNAASEERSSVEGDSLSLQSRATAGGPSTFLFQRVQFATEANPMARIAYALYKGKLLNAVSVGFVPLRWDDANGSEKASRVRRRYLEQELLEVSAVGIPANPNALQLGFKAGVIQKADLRELLELVETVLDCSVAREHGRREAEGKGLMRLAKEVARVMRGR